MKKLDLFYLLLLPYLVFYWELESGRWLISLGFILIVWSHHKYKNSPLNVVLALSAFQFHALFTRLYLLPGDVIRGTMEAGVGMGMVLIGFIIITPFLVLFPLDVLYKKNKKNFFLLAPSLFVLAFWLFLLYLDANTQSLTSFF